MHTYAHATSSALQPTSSDGAADNAERSRTQSLGQGIISEVVYDEDQSVVGHILLPLLRLLGTQSRWLLWLTPSRKLSRPWLEQSGLPLEKMVQLRQPSAYDSVAAMEKALLTGNYSVILGWFPQELTADDKIRLREAAQHGGTYGFIMYPQNEVCRKSGQFSGLKIHSTLYH
ncbi:SOS-induced cell division inhibitor SulA [Sodalis sp. RH21]|uniref:SOS-induced cell division inhibitor SulA n=1 Tax=unclassified Sodalis (in: enterobacteria) TaxID=2636512 RepID=UPI0039B4C84F